MVPDVAVLSAGREYVVIVDDGYSYSYDQSRLAYAYDFSGSGDADASTPGLYSHGSWVAQLATTVAPEAGIIHLKVFSDGGNAASIRDIEEALQWAVSAAASITIAAVNLSLGFGATDKVTLTSLSDEFAALASRGVVNVVAAGNAGSAANGLNVIAADPNVVAVSAVRDDGDFASFSQRDPFLTDLAAVGENVTVETATGLRGSVNGTSFAAPLVAGAAALLQQASEAIYGHRLDGDALLGLLQASGQPVLGAAPAAGYVVLNEEAALVDLAAMAGLDLIRGGSIADGLVVAEGSTAVLGGGGDDTIMGGSGDDVLAGDGGFDVLFGGDGHDTLVGGRGDDILIGGDGWDTARLGGAADDYLLLRAGEMAGAIDLRTGDGGGDAMLGVEAAAFGDGVVTETTVFDPFDALAYIASYTDLIAAYGTDAGTGLQHYVHHGHGEGRQIEFDGLAYIRGYSDLVDAFGADGQAGARHFIEYGHREGRSAHFDTLAAASGAGAHQVFSDLEVASLL